MADKPKSTLTIRTLKRKPSLTPGELRPIRFAKQRTAKELEPIAAIVYENTVIMQRLRASIGSHDRVLGEQLMDEVTKYAQTVDPTVSFSDGTRIVAILLRKVGQFK